MSLRFQRSIKILPGLRLNLSKSGIGVSAGVKGLHVGMDGKGRPYSNVSAPGTGLSDRQYVKPGEASASVSGFAIGVLIGVVAMAVIVGILVMLSN